MLRTIWGDDDRYVNSTGRKLEGIYLKATVRDADEDGYLWIMGRIDDVIKLWPP